MRHTLQKQIIMDTVQRMHNHPDAEEIYREIHLRHPSISKATVYRNLNALADQGQILRVKVSDGADRYDFNAHKHYHMRCRACGRVFDAPIAYFDNLEASLKEADGFIAEEHVIEFIGLCADCK